MIALLLLTTCLVPQVQPESRPQAVSPVATATPTPLRGTWHGGGESEIELRVEADRVALWRGEELRFHLVVGPEDDGVRVWTAAGPADWRMTRDGEQLVFDPGDGERRLARREAPERTHVPTLLELGAPGKLAIERIRALRKELRGRGKRDQEVRKSPSGEPGGMPDPELCAAMDAVDRDNTAWLRSVVGEVGWIDRKRFGPAAAHAAFLIVQHSGDLPLMLAALPHLESEVRSRRADPQDFALLFDRTQMRLGRRQRYGTQVVGKTEGDLWLFPLEDPEGVEELREEIRVFSLKTYLEFIENQTGRKVRR